MAAVVADLIPIPVENFGAMWPYVSHWLDAMAEGSGGRLGVPDIVRAIHEREMQLWAAMEARDFIGAMLSEVLVHPRMKETHLLAATGHNADEWTPLMPRVEDWSRQNGCSVLKATCRPGWKKLLRPLGFEETHSVVEKRL